MAPRKLVEVISFSPAMRSDWRSSGVATAEAMISGLAPGKAALTSIVAYSTWGSGETGKNWYAIMPDEGQRNREQRGTNGADG